MNDLSIAFWYGRRPDKIECCSSCVILADTTHSLVQATAS